MSNFLTNVKINNLQTELDALDIYTHQQVFAGGLHNPLGSDMICQGNDITTCGNIDTQTANISGQLNCQGASVLTTITASGNVTVPSLTCNGVISGNNITAIGTNPLTINVNPSSYMNLNTAGRTIMGEIFPSTVQSNTNCGTTFRQLSDINNVNSIQVSISNGIVATNTIEAYNGPGINCLSTFIFAPTQTYGDVVCTSVTSSGLITASDGLTIDGPTVSNDNIRTSGIIETNYLESLLGNAGTIEIQSPTDFNYPANFNSTTTFAQTLTVPDLIMGAGGVINGDPTNLYTMNNVGELNARNLRATGNVTASTAVGTPALSLGGAYPVTLQSNNTLNAAGYPALQLEVLKDGTPVNSLVYDTVFNPPPSVSANTLAGVLTAGNNANLQNILGVQTLQTNQIQASGGGLITIEDALVSNTTIAATNLTSPLFTLVGAGATPTGISYNSPFLQVKPASQTIYGNVYDTVYNKPPTPSGGGGGPSVGFPGDRTNIQGGGNFDTFFTDPNGARWYAAPPQAAWTIPSTAGPFNTITMTVTNFVMTSTMGDVGDLYLYITNDATNFPGGCGGGRGMISDHSAIINANGVTLPNLLLSSINAVAGNNIYIMVCASTQWVQTNLGFNFYGIQFTLEQTPVLTITFDPA